MRLYHGTSAERAAQIVRSGLRSGSYVTTDFDLAVSYALRHDRPIVLEVRATTAPPAERAYDEEYVTSSAARILAVLAPAFDAIPEDWMELTDDLTGRKYPALFARENWRHL